MHVAISPDRTEASAPSATFDNEPEMADLGNLRNATQLAQASGIELVDLYEGLGARIYDASVIRGSSDSELAAFHEILRNSPGTVVDLGAGSGRLSLALAALGRHVIGVDLSADMLNLATERLASAPTRIRDRVSLHHGDMRSYAAPATTAAVVIGAGSISLLTPAERRALLARLATELPNALIVLSVYDIDRFISTALSSTTIIVEESLGFVGTLTDSFDPNTGVREVMLIPHVLGGESSTKRWFTSRIHMTSTAELRSDAAAAGLDLVAEQVLHQGDGRSFSVIGFAATHPH